MFPEFERLPHGGLSAGFFWGDTMSVAFTYDGPALTSNVIPP